MRNLKESIIVVLFYLSRIFPIKKNKIVFDSMDGKFSDNGKYVALELIKLSNKIELIWLADKKFYKDFPQDIKVVNRSSIKKVYELSTAKIWVGNYREPSYVRKRKKQFYINLDHGGTVLKMVENDAKDTLPKSYIAQAKHDSKLCDLMISDSEFRTKLIPNTYWYKGEILECGLPKAQLLYESDSKLKEKIYSNLKIDLKYKIALYAPTFRSDHNYDYGFDYIKIERALKEKFGGEWVILRRMHPGITDIKFSSDKVMDVSGYADMQELLFVSAILITDYSGTMFEMLRNTNRYVFIYANDMDSYDRGLYFELSDLPFLIASNIKTLEKNILCFDKKKYQENVSEFIKKIGLKDSDASKNIAKRILQEISKEEKSDNRIYSRSL